MKKIALLGPTHPFRGGIVHFNSRLADALCTRSDLEISMFYWSKPYPVSLLPKSMRNREDKQSHLSFYRPGQSILSYSNPWSWFRLLRILRKKRFDIFITHWAHPIHFPVLGIIFAAIRFLTRIQIILIMHNVLPHEHFPGAKIFSRIIGNMTHRVIVHGSSEAQKARLCKISTFLIHKAFHPVYDQFIRPAASRESIRSALGLRRRVFLFFGFIRPYKGIECLLQAFQQIAPEFPDITLLIVGEYFYPGAEIQVAVTDCYPEIPRSFGVFMKGPVSDQLVWINRYVPNEDVGRYFCAADAVVIPYHQTSQSGPLQIAFAFDLPVIASDIPTFREIVVNGVSGYLFRQGDPKDLAEVLKLFLHKPIPPSHVHTYRQQFNWNEYVRILIGDDRSPEPFSVSILD